MAASWASASDCKTAGGAIHNAAATITDGRVLEPILHRLRFRRPVLLADPCTGSNLRRPLSSFQTRDSIRVVELLNIRGCSLLQQRECQKDAGLLRVQLIRRDEAEFVVIELHVTAYHSGRNTAAAHH